MQSVERKRAGRDNEHRSSDRNIFSTEMKQQMGKGGGGAKKS